MFIKSTFLCKRHFCQLAPKLKDAQKMLAWSKHAYGDVNELQLGQSRIPVIDRPYQVLVAVQAASVNPIDSLMLGQF